MTMERQGSRWVGIGAATNRWPEDGIGGATTTAANSVLETSKRTMIDGFLLTTAHTAATTLTIYMHDGTTVVHTIAIAANQACPLPVPLGGENGLEVPSGFAAKVSNTATTLLLYFRRADGQPYDD